MSSKPQGLVVNDIHPEISPAYVAEMKELVDFTIVHQAPHDILAERIKEAVEKLQEQGGHFVVVSHAVYRWLPFC